MLVRTVPQMNVFVIGMPLKIILGLVVLSMVLPIYSSLAGSVFESMFAGMERAFSALIGA
jgi:flagellar biosynthetic protein FliR